MKFEIWALKLCRYSEAAWQVGRQDRLRLEYRFYHLPTKCFSYFIFKQGLQGLLGCMAVNSEMTHGKHVTYSCSGVQGCEGPVYTHSSAALLAGIRTVSRRRWGSRPKPAEGSMEWGCLSAQMPVCGPACHGCPQCCHYWDHWRKPLRRAM